MLLEVIVASVADAREAARGGADRLEIVRDLGSGGLTPPLGLVEAIAAAVPLPLRVMVRENDGYSTDAGELPTLRAAAAAFADAQVDGLVIGFARDAIADLASVEAVLSAAPDVRVTFHRAFDQLDDPFAAVDLLARIPRVDRILTSGGAGTSADRRARLEAWQRHARSGLTILAGGGIDEEMLAALAATGTIREAHVGRAARTGGTHDGPVSAACVARLRAAMSK